MLESLDPANLCAELKSASPTPPVPMAPPPPPAPRSQGAEGAAAAEPAAAKEEPPKEDDWMSTYSALQSGGAPDAKASPSATAAHMAAQLSPISSPHLTDLLTSF